ncbi:MAG: glucokinase [Burkholderiales bacterium]|nr:glucokinase [Burkholderiales bacterium]
MTDDAAPYPRLVADVGGTHARFGWVGEPGAAVSLAATYACADFSGLDAVIARYLDEHAEGRAPVAAAIAVAVPVDRDRLTMTNRAWTFSVTELARTLSLERIVVLNDYAALALALPALVAHELRQVGGGVAVAGAPLAVLGPGTGLGVSGLLRSGSLLLPVPGDGGHVTLAAADAAEDRVIESLRRRFGHVSAERALSGDGLVNLYRAQCEIAGRAPEALTAAEVTARDRTGSDAACRAAVDLFFAFLGSIAGNLALTLGALGGVYVGGGIVPRLGERIARSPFRERFESKGRYRAWLAAIPCWVIDAGTAPALRGANRALDQVPPGARTG